ncbi:putative membrane protein [Sphingobacterium sp. 2149]|nr:putative membrane protein [Sphingobacterium sp. 2149]
MIELTRKQIKSQLKTRQVFSNKWDYGRAFIIAGQKFADSVARFGGSWIFIINTSQRVIGKMKYLSALSMLIRK